MENKKNCQVVPDTQGNAIRVSKNNPEYGVVRITQSKSKYNQSGWLQKSTRSTLIRGKVEDLQDEGYNVNTVLAGNIVVREQLTPFTDDPKFRDKDLKMAGDTGIICTGVCPESGELLPIYRKDFYDETGTLSDVLVAHVNGDAIREANASTTETTTTKTKSSTKKEEKVEEKVEEPVEEVVEMEEETFEL
tara:strand:- start:466 stop:1038 length:573 start_codon:yes stop_codon:yes gene_type:complete